MTDKYTDKEVEQINRQHEPDWEMVGTDCDWCAACTEPMPCTVYRLSEEVLANRFKVAADR